MFWTGDNPLTPNRIQCIYQFENISKSIVCLVTKKNLNNFILETEPLHPAYNYLSETHKADYLRTYFMHFYGGGYSDIKMTTGSWEKAFNDLKNSDKYIIGYKEIGPSGVAGPKDLQDNWNYLIGNGCYICKPRTEFTEKWYKTMIQLLDSKLSKLYRFPATFPQDCAENSNGKYPIEWNEMLGRIFHPLCYEYRDYIMNTLPICILKNYR